ncbi:hypothetical protein H4S08_001124 [Coemansia sp. RSA 1365]|nr:hypothetical protein H4S08_001124 [Coemansia sp. RSA 1365]
MSETEFGPHLRQGFYTPGKQRNRASATSSRTSSVRSLDLQTNKRESTRGQGSPRRQQPRFLSPASSGIYRRRLIARAANRDRKQNESAPPSLAGSAALTTFPMLKTPGSDNDEARQIMLERGACLSESHIFQEKVCRSASCCEDRQNYTKRSSCAGPEYFDMHLGMRVSGGRRTPLRRRSSMDTICGHSIENALALEPLVCSKLARLSPPAKQLAVQQHYYPHASTDETSECIHCVSTGKLGTRDGQQPQREQEPLPLRGVPAPTPQFLRQLGILKQANMKLYATAPDAEAEVPCDMCGNCSGNDDDNSAVPVSAGATTSIQDHSRDITEPVAADNAPAADEIVPLCRGRSMSLPRLRPAPHFEALVNAAHMSACLDSRPPQIPHRISSRLARFTRRLVSGVLFSPRDLPGPEPLVNRADPEEPMREECATSQFTIAADSISTFSCASTSYAPATRLNYRQQVDEQSGAALSKPRDSVSEFVPRVSGRRRSDGSRASVTRRISVKSPTSKIATRRNVNLTIPTAATKPSLFAHGLFGMPALSPACTSLSSEVVTASATACGSALASPMLQSASMDRNTTSVFDMPFSYGQPLRTAPIGATSAHGMLRRLAGARSSSVQMESIDSHDTQSLTLHMDVQEEWGVFISKCMKDIDSQRVPHLHANAALDISYETLDNDESLSGSVSTAVVPSYTDKKIYGRWFAGLDSQNYDKLYSLIAEGIPARFRRQVWMECTGALDKTFSYVDCSSSRREEIELDLPRTTVDTRSPHYDDLAMTSLRYVLYGYAAASPGTGYCQGMNKIAYGLLSAGLGASDALAMLQAVLDGGVLPEDMFRSPMVGLQADQLVLDELVARRLPLLSEHLRAKLGSTASLAPVTVSWFLSLFVDCLPETHRLRVWDMLFAHGYAVIFQGCLAILELCQDALMQCATPTGIYMMLQNVCDIMKHVDVEEFVECAFGHQPAKQRCLPLVDMRMIEEIRHQVWPPTASSH